VADNGVGAGVAASERYRRKLVHRRVFHRRRDSRGRPQRAQDGAGESLPRAGSFVAPSRSHWPIHSGANRCVITTATVCPAAGTTSAAVSRAASPFVNGVGGGGRDIVAGENALQFGRGAASTRRRSTDLRRPPPSGPDSDGQTQGGATSSEEIRAEGAAEVGQRWHGGGRGPEAEGGLFQGTRRRVRPHRPSSSNQRDEAAGRPSKPTIWMLTEEGAGHDRRDLGQPQGYFARIRVAFAAITLLLPAFRGVIINTRSGSGFRSSRKCSRYAARRNFERRRHRSTRTVAKELGRFQYFACLTAIVPAPGDSQGGSVRRNFLERTKPLDRR